MFSDSREIELKEFVDSLNLEVDNLELLDKALTHPSFTFENNLDRIQSYERLEFLGDSVLKIFVSRYLYEKFEDYDEGALSRLRSTLVSDNLIEKLARRINLGKYVKMGFHEQRQGGLDRVSTLACSFEAILGAFYLDGKFHQLSDFLEKIYSEIIDEVSANILSYNAKAILQEYTQSQSQELPIYSIVSEKGLDHKKTFKIEVEYRNKVLGAGIGSSKKEAQQNAAMQACEKLGLMNNE